MTENTDLKQLAEQMAKHVGSFEDIKAFQKQLMQSFIDTALEAEMQEHLGYAKHEKAGKANSRNGHTKKTVQRDTGKLKIATPRDREGKFEPVLVKKHQTRISGLDDKILMPLRAQLFVLRFGQRSPRPLLILAHTLKDKPHLRLSTPSKMSMMWTSLIP